MTRAEILKLKGYKLDKLVHEQVMGECVHEWPKWKSTFNCKKCNYDLINIPPIAPMIPPYSSDIQYAWEVVEKMKAYNLMLLFYHYDQKEQWQGAFYLDGSSLFASDTAPEVICKSALLAVQE